MPTAQEHSGDQRGLDQPAAQDVQSKQTTSLELSRAGMLSTDVPPEWRSILADCEEFINLTEEKKSEGFDDAHYRALHDRIVAASEQLVEPQAIERQDQGLMRRSVARALLLVSQLKRTISADTDYLDTAGSRTFYLFKNDFLHSGLYDTEITLEGLRECCVKQLGVNPEMMETVNQKVERRLDRVERTRSVVKAIKEEFGIAQDSEDIDGAIHGFFRALYPDTGISQEEVEIVTTSTMIFLTLPFKEGTNDLTTRRYDALTADEKKPTQEFLKSLKKFSQEKFAHFPAFGFIDEDAVDMTAIGSIAKRAGLKKAEVLAEIQSCVTILPHAEMDKYIVHDVWGHSWQATLSGLGRMYQEIATYAGQLSINESAGRINRPGETISFRECFIGEGDEFALDEEKLREFYIAEVTERLPIAMTPVFAEMLADVIEYKFLEDNPGKESLMESSSKFKFCPTKLDLLMEDLPFYYRQATKAFRLWAQKEERQEATLEELTNLGASEEAARNALTHAAQLFSDYEEELFQPKLEYTTEDGDFTVNPFGRVMLNFISIHAAITETYDKLDQLPAHPLPLRSFKKLMAVSAALFYEENPQKNFWRVDEFLTLHFVPMCEQLAGRDEDSTKTN